MKDADLHELLTLVRAVYDDWRERDPEQYCKSAEGEVEVTYPGAFSDLPPTQIERVMVYSYALGPSRTHYFEYAPVNAHPKYYTWESPTPVAKAIEVVRQWHTEWEQGLQG